MASDKSEKSSNATAADAIMQAEAEGLDERTKRLAAKGANGPPKFTLSSLWQAPPLNPVNLKAYTLPVFNLRDPYGRNFHLAWLGFFVAFFSWFAFPPLIPEAIKADLSLTPTQIADSNIVALLATLVMRVVTGPLVDKFGPRICMATILLAGAIPSGLAAAVFNDSGLLAIRFFIGILGATFVCSVAWTSCFFDKSIVGTANALVAGWGNAGGGIVFIVQTAIFSRLVSDGVSQHNAWRACFNMVPVPLLLLVAAATLIFGTDHPTGKWALRHTTPATAIAMSRGGQAPHLDSGEKAAIQQKLHDKVEGRVTVAEANETDAELDAMVTSGVDTAVNEELTGKSALKILLSPVTWLPALMYFTTFGWELAFDSNFANTLFAVYNQTGRDPSFTQLHAGYLTSILGILNFVTRPFGGYVADQLYRRGGVRSKKFLTITLGVIMGAMSIGLGFYIDAGLTGGTATPTLGPIIAFEVIAAIACEVANGSNFSLVPHVHSNNNGAVSGLIGAMGNFGGIMFALVFRFQSSTGAPGKPYWIIGIVSVAVNLLCVLIPCPSS